MEDADQGKQPPCGGKIGFDFAVEPLEQKLVTLSVNSYNAGREAADLCDYKDRDGYPMFTCEQDGTICYAGWVVPKTGKPEFEIGCGDADSDPVQCEVQEFECCDKEIGSHIYQGCAPMPGGGTCGGIWVPCEEGWADCG